MEEKKKFGENLCDFLTVAVIIINGITVFMMMPTNAMQQIIQIIAGIKGLLWAILFQVIALRYKK